MLGFPRSGAVAAAAVFALAPVASLGATAPAARVDEIFQDYNRTDSPGCAVGVIREGQLIFAKGYGTREHKIALARCGPCPTHRRSFAPLAKQQQTDALFE